MGGLRVADPPLMRSTLVHQTVANLTVTFTADQLKILRAEALLDGSTSVARWVRDRAIEAADDRAVERQHVAELRTKYGLPQPPTLLPTTRRG